MGLDSGITIKGKTSAGKLFLEQIFESNYDKYHDNYDFGYWRKCWNIRERFYDVFKNRITDHNNCNLELSIEDLLTFKNDVLIYFLNPDNWVYNEKSSQIFSWEEELTSISKSICDIYYFLGDLEENFTDEDFEIEFYDSY